jgi:hypothetical protein
MCTNTNIKLTISDSFGLLRTPFGLVRTLFGLVRTSVLLHKNNKYNLEGDACRATLLRKSKLKVEEMCTNTNIKLTISDSFGLLRTPFGLVRTRSGTSLLLHKNNKNTNISSQEAPFFRTAFRTRPYQLRWKNIYKIITFPTHPV